MIDKCKNNDFELVMLGSIWGKLASDDIFMFQALRKWGEILMTVPMRVIVFFAACGLLAAGVYGTTQITQKFEWKKLGRDGSYFRDYANMRDDTFPAGYDVSVIIPGDMDYSSSTLQEKIVMKHNVLYSK